jgi:NADH dehydrogenase
VLERALDGCGAVIHCAGINREIGTQTYDAVHVRGTQVLVAAARAAGVRHVSVLSFLRARPDGPTAYHRTKWAAEAIVRESGIPYTVLKAGVIHGRGDHMLDHLSRALYTFPVFGLVGMRERPVRPVAVDDVARILEAAATGDERLKNRTIAVLGPEEMALGEPVRRVAATIHRRPLYVRLPIVAHLALAHVWEAVMRVPLLAVAQAHILAEGVVIAAPPADEPPEDLRPVTPFSESVIRAGLPDPGPFTCQDLRWCRA